MSKQKGMLVTCHRCGATVFLKYIKTDYFDGGFTESDDFEEKPEGWTCKFPEEDGNSYADLCPKCTETFMELIYDFYSCSPSGANVRGLHGEHGIEPLP